MNPALTTTRCYCYESTRCWKRIGCIAQLLASTELRELQLARHAVAHNGAQMQEEQRARELAALGVKLSCLTYRGNLVSRGRSFG